MRLVFEIGGIPIGVEHDSPDWDALLRRTYGGFLSNRRPMFMIRADVVSRFHTALSHAGMVLTPRTDGVYDMLWYDIEGVMNLHEGECRVTVADNVHSISGVLRNVLAKLIFRRNGFLVHAASFVRGDMAYVFPGVSTAGKSTLAGITLKACEDCMLLTDEVSLVRRVRGRWIAFGTPFWGDARISGRNISMPVGKICFIEKSGMHRLKPLQMPDAYARLVQNIFQAAPEKEDVSLAMGMAAEILHHVPAYALEFRLDAGFWELL